MSSELQDKRVLIVEDEYFVAVALRDALIAAGAQVIGPAGRLDQATTMAEGDVHIALLDVNLGDTRSYAIADALKARSVPFVFVTGYDRCALPEAYRDAPCISKPFTERAVIEQIKTMIAGEECL